MPQASCPISASVKSKMVSSIRYLSEAAMLAVQPRITLAVISITEPGRTAPLLAGWGALLRVAFCDAEWDDAMCGRMRQRGRFFDPAKSGFPTHGSIAPIRPFVALLLQRPDITELLVHCHAGKRRSAAVAKYAAKQLGMPFDDSYSEYNQTVLRILLEDKAQDQTLRPPNWMGRLLSFTKR